MDQLRICCDNAAKFPRKESLLDQNSNDDTLDALSSRLKEREKVLFQADETDARYQRLHFLETTEASSGL